MSIKRAHWIILQLRINSFAIPILLPFRCLNEVLEGFTDLLTLFRFANRKVWLCFHCAESFVSELQNYGNLDLIDITAGHGKDSVKVKFLLRY